jgi:fructokinase
MVGQYEQTRSEIACFGEALIDLLPIVEDGRTVGFRMHPGGSLLNVAVALARLGRHVALAGKVSTDFFGRHLRGYLEDEGVQLEWLASVEAPSTLAFVATEGGEPSFAFYGEAAADTLVGVNALPKAFFERTAILHVGSISLLRGATPDAVVAACERLAGRALLSLDPNLRPALVTDEDTYRGRLRRLFGLVDIIKVSAADMGWLAPDRDVESAAIELLSHGPALVVVTRGGDGSVAVRRTGGSDGFAVARVAAFAVDVVDTIGAGDAYDAGLLGWLAERGVTSRASLDRLSTDDLTTALRFAAAVAALNCTRAGADPPTGEAVKRFLAAHLQPAV